MIIELPFPNPALNPNRSKGRHWSTTAGIRKKAKEDAYNLTRLAMIAQKAEKPKGDVPLSVTFILPDNRSRDRDNLLASCKNALDGVADALGINDAQFEPVTISRSQGKKPGAVILRIGKTWDGSPTPAL
jgi:crossover junction endodeoxyribonuclease RusA